MDLREHEIRSEELSNKDYAIKMVREKEDLKRDFDRRFENAMAGGGNELNDDEIDEIVTKKEEED